ncbi:phage tail termination protein [Pasteurella testudinis]|uniref:phage tail termination protein n=1 Tax=Pasteurella testudinis TaxID=761 RepID=UPI000E071245|nr:hypothetical protein [Pasteurella testudinis]SUB51636.1 Uncharacterised protein [Pasteurella testudinis]
MNLLTEFKNWLSASKLLTGYQIQLYQWRDRGEKVKAYAVFMPDGGTPIRQDLGGESYITLNLIGSVQTGYDAMPKAQEIIDHIKANSSAEFGYVENMGAIPRPVFTEDNRIVVPLQFRIVHDN